MEEQLITLETAKLAQELGFEVYSNQLNSPFYVLSKTKYYEEGELTEISLDQTCCDDHSVPENQRLYCATQSVLQKWLREERTLHVFVTPTWDPEERERSHANVKWRNQFTPQSAKVIYDRWEDALEAGLLMALKVLQQLCQKK